MTCAEGLHFSAFQYSFGVSTYVTDQVKHTIHSGSQVASSFLHNIRTLRDYMYHMKAKVGFSSEGDTMLICAAEVFQNEKLAQCGIFIIDKIHI